MKNLLLGGVLLLLVVVLWVASSTTMQFIMNSYPKPYLLTYMTTSMFSCYLISMLWKRDLIAKRSRPGLFQTSGAALKFCPLWFFANYFFNISLNMTSISSNTILTSTSGIFTLVFSIIFLNTPSTTLKWLAVIISFGGVVCIGLSEEKSGSDSLIGDVFALFGAMLYAAYSVCLKRLEKIDTVLLFGCIGFINFCVFLPGAALVNLFGLEHFKLPGHMEATLILANALIGSMFSDLLWAWSVDYLSPSICTLGLSLTIPLSMVVDYSLKDKFYSINYIFGAVMIVLGFVMITLVEADETKKIEKVENFIKEV